MVQLVDVLITISVSFFFFLMSLAVKYLHDMTVAVKNVETTLDTKLDTINSTVDGISDQMSNIKELIIRVDTRLATTDGGIDQTSRESQRSTESKQRLSDQSQGSPLQLVDDEPASYATSTRTIELDESDISLQIAQVRRPHSTMVTFTTPNSVPLPIFFSATSLRDDLSESGPDYFDQHIDVVVKGHKISVIIPSTDSEPIQDWIEEAIDIIDSSDNVSDEALPE